MKSFPLLPTKQLQRKLWENSTRKTVVPLNRKYCKNNRSSSEQSMDAFEGSIYRLISLWFSCQQRRSKLFSVLFEESSGIWGIDIRRTKRGRRARGWNKMKSLVIGTSRLIASVDPGIIEWNFSRISLNSKDDDPMCYRFLQREFACLKELWTFIKWTTCVAMKSSGSSSFCASFYLRGRAGSLAFFPLLTSPSSPRRQEY